VHDLEALLHLSGREEKITRSYTVEWSTVAQWNPEWRYEPVGSTSRLKATAMLRAVDTLLKVL
jgi:hypothetical protein